MKIRIMSPALKLSVVLTLVVLVLFATLSTEFAALLPGLSAQQSPINSPLNNNSPLSPLPTPSPTATPISAPNDGVATATPTRSRRVVNEIIHPGDGDAISSFTAIRGTALIKAFRRYDVHIAATGSEEWRWLTSGSKVIRDDVIVLLDTTDYEDGFYDIRVRAINDVGNYSEAFLRRLQIRNANPPTATPVFNAEGIEIPVTATPTLTATPSPQPTYESFVPGGRGIYAPASDSLVRGFTQIVGTVNGYRQRPFEEYELAISVAGLEDWHWIYTGSTQTWQSDLYVLDSARFADGLYDLRLRNVFRDGNYEEYFVRRLQIANQSAALPLQNQQNGIYTPRSGSWINGVVDFVGTAVASDLRRWELHFSPAGADNWSFIVSSEQPVINGLLATLDLSRVNRGHYDFRLRVVRGDLNYDDFFRT